MMKTKRIFIGTKIDSAELTKNYASLQRDLRNIVHGKWVELKNMHFTYHFLGDVEVEKVPLLKEAVKDSLAVYDANLQIKGLGAFPHLKNPRVLFMNIFDSNDLVLRLHSQLKLQLENIDMPTDNKLFKPHLTMVRIKTIESPEKFTEIINKYRSFIFTQVKEMSVQLIESRLYQGGPVYSEL